MPIKDFVVQSGCTFKYGVDFRGWTDKRYIHSLTSADDGIRSGPYHNEPEELFMYTNMSANCEPLDLIQPWQLKDEAQENDNHPNQFHFDTQKLNKFLHTQLERNNIKYYDDKITEVKVSEWEEVEAIESETARYEADIFVDASGFRRIIASQLDGFWYISKQDEMIVDMHLLFNAHEKTYYYIPQAQK